jgi:poly(A) polymerase
MRIPRFEEHLELHRLDCLSSHGDLANYRLARSKYEESPPEELRPQRLLNGADLIAAGYRPGPEFSRMLEAAEDAQLEGRVRTKEEALALVQTRFGLPVSPD